MEENNQGFDFLAEIEKNNNYQLLFPQRQQGLAIMYLYHGIQKGRYPDRKFKEKDVCNALELFYSTTGYTRIPQEHFIQWIGELKEYFLMYDEENQVYLLKEYAIDYCRYAEKILQANFSPTKIEIICSQLRQQLERVRGENQIKEWLEIHFDTFKPEMKSQVDFLDRQIDQAVLELRQTAGTHDQSIIIVLKQIDSELDHLKTQNKELRIAFQQMKSINARLEELSIAINDAELYEAITSARSFFPEIKYRLSLVDRRLDRIHPKLRQFFGTLNKPLFNVRAEKFLVFLLQHSKLEYKKRIKHIVLPSNVSLPHVYIPTPQLPIAERREDLFPVPPRPVQDYKQNAEQVKRLSSELGTKLWQQDEIETWLDKIKEEVNSKKQVLISDYFFSLSEMKEGDIEMPVKLVHRIIREAPFHPDLKIEVKKQLVQSKKLPGVFICEMSITPK
jgi:hypothetical protein